MSLQRLGGAGSPRGISRRYSHCFILGQRGSRQSHVISSAASATAIRDGLPRRSRGLITSSFRCVIVLDSFNPAAVKLQMRDRRRFVEARLRDLSALWDGDPRIARQEMAKHVQKIMLKPMLRTYEASGVWDWLGVLASAATMVVPGDGIGPNVCRLDLSGWRRRDSRKGIEHRLASRSSDVGSIPIARSRNPGHDDIWLVSFMDYDLGYFDLETRVLEPLENPFGPKVLPM
jgi:hypothetical protein